MRRNSPNCTKNQSLGNFKKQTIIAHLISDTIMILKTGETVEGCERIGAPDPVYEVLPRNISIMFEAPADGVYQGKNELEPYGSNRGSNDPNRDPNDTNA